MFNLFAWPQLALIHSLSANVAWWQYERQFCNPEWREPYVVVQDAIALKKEHVIVGYFCKRLVLGGKQFSNEGDASGFVGKLTERGILAWVKFLRYAWGSRDHFESVAVSADGDITVVGHTANHGITVRYDADGKLRWSRTLGQCDWAKTQHVATDSVGDVLISGLFCMPEWIVGGTRLLNATQPMPHDEEPGVEPGPTYRYRRPKTPHNADVFVAKLRKSDGEVVWIRRFGGSSPYSEREKGGDQAGALAVDAHGNVFAGMTLYGQIFGPPYMDAETPTSVVVRLNGETGALEWSSDDLGNYLNSVVVVDSTVYISGLIWHETGYDKKQGQITGFLKALSTQTGAAQWTKLLDASDPLRPPDLLLAVGPQKTLLLAATARAPLESVVNFPSIPAKSIFFANVSLTNGTLTPRLILPWRKPRVSEGPVAFGESDPGRLWWVSNIGEHTSMGNWELRSEKTP